MTKNKKWHYIKTMKLLCFRVSFKFIGMACSYFSELWAIIINLCLSIMTCTNVVHTNGLGLTFHVSVKSCKFILCCVVNVNVEINTHIILHDHLK